MLAEQRARAILQQVTQRQTVSVTDLCQITGASEATIRRDLNTLARQGRLVKIHGGATSLEEEEFLSREIAPVLEKYSGALDGKETELKV